MALDRKKLLIQALRFLLYSFTTSLLHYRQYNP